MGEIVGVGLVSHAPTIMMTKEQRYALNESKEISLVTGFQDMRREILEPLKPDVLLLLTRIGLRLLSSLSPAIKGVKVFIHPRSCLGQ